LRLSGADPYFWAEDRQSGGIIAELRLIEFAPDIPGVPRENSVWEINMEFTLQGADDWTLPIVRQYFETAESGFPYISCPDQLRPATAFSDSWWVIYSPNYDGGVIVEGYLIEQWRERQRKLLALWSVLGILLFYFFAFSGFWLMLVIAMMAWLALAFAVVWLNTRSTFAKRIWVTFPEELTNALGNGAAVLASQQADHNRKRALPDFIGQATGKIGGTVIEIVAGTAAGKLSEIALDEAFKSLAQQLLRKSG
jgi:hypothetical protein